MARNAARTYDGGATAFFVETLCQEADTVLRFAYALTLSEDIAKRLVYKTYQTIVPHLTELLNREGSTVRLFLLRRLWELHHENDQEGQASSNILFPLLRTLELQTRALLFLVDVIGLTLEEVGEITKLDEIDMRRHLAQGRKRLLSFRFE